MRSKGGLNVKDIVIYPQKNGNDKFVFCSVLFHFFV